MEHKKNRLQNETSQYLKAHANNPVDWYPWGKEALSTAKKENKPIFLSIGYSACHWCHVMEKESFENAQIAEIMNSHFINIKVDREERQDLDHIYMTAVQLLTGRGGWPMSVFLTPDLKPFYGGTYFPPEDRYGMPSFKKILLGVANAWTTKPAEILSSSQQLFESLAQVHDSEGGESKELALNLFEESIKKILPNFDEQFGGFGGAPKFFHTMDMQAVLLHYSRTKDKKAEPLLKKTLAAWAMGGIYDQLAGGFHRYSTDERWFAPHFEKMLYDNALVTATFLEAYKIFKEPLYSRVASHTLDYVLREMTSPEGAYYSTQDADSEGEEGKFYVWSKEEINGILGAEISEKFCKAYSVTSEGNWEHSNILHMTLNLEQLAIELKVDLIELEDMLSLSRRKLLTERNKRITPMRDEKIITSWNAMLIETMAKASQILGNEKYLESAKKNAAFLWQKLKNSDELLHSYQNGKATLKAYLDDYACFANALLTLYEVCGEEDWLVQAETLILAMLAEFFDDQTSDFYFTGKYHESLIYRPKESHDGATPSATALAVTALARIGRITSNKEYLDVAAKTTLNYQDKIQKTPSAYAQFLLASEILRPGCKEIVFCPGEILEENSEVRKLLQEIYFGPHVIVYPSKTFLKSSLLAGKHSINKKATVYICQNQSCKAPIVGLEELIRIFSE